VAIASGAFVLLTRYTVGVNRVAAGHVLDGVITVNDAVAIGTGCAQPKRRIEAF
jgi:hypothetical protein